MKAIVLLLGILVFSSCSVSRQTRTRDFGRINTGTSANDHTGETLRSAFTKINSVIDDLNRIGVSDIKATAPEINVLRDINTTGSINIRDITTIPTIYSAAGDTSNYPTPGKIGNIYVDTSAGDVYISIKAIRHDGWIKVN